MGLNILYSYSRIAKFIECPRRFYNIYILGKREPSSQPAELGKIVHTSLELMLNNGYDINFAIDKAIEKEQAKFEHDRKEIFWLVKNGASFFGQLQHPLIIEKHSVIEIDTDPKDIFSSKYKIQGYLDVLSNDSVWDWKSGRTKADLMQLKVYGFLATLEGKKIKTARQIYLRDNEVIEIEINNETIIEAKEWLIKNIDLIEEKIKNITLVNADPLIEFPCTPNFNCKYCSFVKECTIEDNPYKEVPKTIEELKQTNDITIEDKIKLAQDILDGTVIDGKLEPQANNNKEAEKIAREVIRLETLLKEYKNTLKEYCTKKGKPIIIDNKKFDFIESQIWKFEPEKIKDLMIELLDQGKNPYDLITLGARNITKLKGKDYNWTDEKIAQFGTINKRKTFKCVSIE